MIVEMKVSTIVEFSNFVQLVTKKFLYLFLNILRGDIQNIKYIINHL